jgi:hypothetical protein
MPRTCATMTLHNELAQTDEVYRANRREIEALTTGRRRARAARRAEVVKIPVVVHVLYNTPEQNVSEAQIKSQLAVLNRDFRKANPDVASVPAPFKPFVADAMIEFALAVRDPNDQPTSGVTRTPTSVAGFSGGTIAAMDRKIKFASGGGKDAWPRDSYLNLWVCDLGSRLLGYAQFPGGPAETDGVVINFTAFGDTGTASAPFDLGRTATHEVGHWLNLLHIWGDDGGGCSGSDNVEDTPNQAGDNAGEPTFPHLTCDNGPDGDMFMNYMDYTDDVAMFMFTTGQVERMDAALTGPRVGLLTSDGLTLPSETPRLQLADLGGVAGGGGPALREAGRQPTRVFDGVAWV